MPNRVLSVPKAALNSTGISQDNIIFGMVLLAFVIFITLKGELRIYMGFFTPGASEGPSAIPVTTTAQAAPASNIPGVSSILTPINNAINSTGLGGLITGLTGKQPLTLNTTGGGLIGGIGSMFSGIGSFFGGQGITGSTSPVTTPQPGSNPTGGIGSA
jgi:hypothetical protein